MAERLRGVASTLPRANQGIRHFIISPPDDHKFINRGDLWAQFRKVYRKSGLLGASVVLHPWRSHAAGQDKNRDKDWLYESPHFHLLAMGKAVRTTDFFNQTGWVIKNLGSRATALEGTIAYELDHVGVYGKSSSIRYYGVCNPRMTQKVEVSARKEVVKCDQCGARTHDHLGATLKDDGTYDLTNTVVRVAMERVRVYSYYRNGTIPPPCRPAS